MTQPDPNTPPVVKGAPGLFVDGAWQSDCDEAPDINPATARPFGTAPVATVADAGVAVGAARRAFDDGRWSALSNSDRQRLLTSLHDSLERSISRYERLNVLEVGTPMVFARGHARSALGHLAFAAEAAGRNLSMPLPEVVAVGSTGQRTLGNYIVKREPVGVVVLLTPFNAPFLLTVAKLAAALAMGNTVVVKPSPETPLVVLALGDAITEVGLPSGVVNIVTGGADVGTALTTDPRVDMVSFTGSDAVGSLIAAQVAPTLKRLVLELGGKSPLVVRADADLELATAIGAANLTTLSGQGCVLATRHLVHRSLHDEYVDRLAARLRSVVVGDPTDPATEMGPLISRAQLERVQRHVDGAAADGAELVCGGGVPAGLGEGFFFEPTLFAGVDNNWRVAQEEIFGPVGVVIAVDGDEHAVHVANDTVYGLGAGIVSEDVGGAYQMAQRLRAGTVMINGGAGAASVEAPFGGYKRSGIGREFGIAGLLEYTETKSISYRAR